MKRHGDGDVEGDAIGIIPDLSHKEEFFDFIEYSLFNENVLFLHGEIDEYVCNEAAKTLEVMSRRIIQKDSSQYIRVVLNSVGGDLYDGLLVFDTIRDIVYRGVPVVIEVRGLAASMAAIILQSASIGKRVASKYTRFLIHEISSVTIGTMSEQKEQVKELEKSNNMCRDILAERLGRSSKEIEEKWTHHDVWFSAEEALAFGLIDEVV